jgi:hypothetical protein
MRMPTKRFRNRTMPLVGGLLLALAAPASQACYSPPASQLIAPDEQVHQALDVALGQVISATPLDAEQVEYRFLVLDQLTGPARKVFTVIGRSADRYGKDTSFNSHTDFAFWARGGGRTWNGSDCIIHPDFVLGNSYLVFLGAAPTWRSFEKIDMIGGSVDQDDKWLVYIKDRLRQRQEVDGSAAAVSGQAAVPGYERIGRFVYAFHRIVSRDSLERKTLAAQQAPTPLLLRAGQLADEFDHILKDGAAVPQAEIDATLGEAAAVRTMLDAWRQSATPPTP